LNAGSGNYCSVNNGTNGALTKRVTFLCVVPILPAVFSFKPIRDLMIEGVTNRVGEEVMDWLKQRFRGRWYWHSFDLEEFEIFVALPERKRVMHYLMRQYLSDTKINHLSLNPDGKIPWNFRSYLIANHFKDRPRNEATFLLKTYDEISAYVKRYLFGQKE